jgi:hypothetical protein
VFCFPTQIKDLQSATGNPIAHQNPKLSAQGSETKPAAGRDVSRKLAELNPRSFVELQSKIVGKPTEACDSYFGQW